MRQQNFENFFFVFDKIANIFFLNFQIPIEKNKINEVFLAIAFYVMFQIFWFYLASNLYIFSPFFVSKQYYILALKSTILHLPQNPVICNKHTPKCLGGVLSLQPILHSVPNLGEMLQYITVVKVNIGGRGLPYTYSEVEKAL